MPLKPLFTTQTISPVLCPYYSVFLLVLSSVLLYFFFCLIDVNVFCSISWNLYTSIVTSTSLLQSTNVLPCPLYRWYSHAINFFFFFFGFTTVSQNSTLLAHKTPGTFLQLFHPASTSSSLSTVVPASRGKVGAYAIAVRAGSAHHL